MAYANLWVQAARPGGTCDDQKNWFDNLAVRSLDIACLGNFCPGVPGEGRYI
jgi:hypothetical protein